MKTTCNQHWKSYTRHFFDTSPLRLMVNKQSWEQKVMASFYKRGTYQWEARIRRRGYPDQSRTFESKVEAQMWALQSIHPQRSSKIKVA